MPTESAGIEINRTVHFNELALISSQGVVMSNLPTKLLRLLRPGAWLVMAGLIAALGFRSARSEALATMAGHKSASSIHPGKNSRWTARRPSATVWPAA
jgi:hypothetical protein